MNMYLNLLLKLLIAYCDIQRVWYIPIKPKPSHVKRCNDEDDVVKSDKKINPLNAMDTLSSQMVFLYQRPQNSKG
jgi:hypothetical protein